jgi:hypothetical protein
MEKALEDAVENTFRFGDVRDTIRERLEEVLVPFIEGYDMSKYVVKLDTILTEIVNGSCLEANKEILENFKYMMTEPEVKELKLSELFEEYKKWVSIAVDTDGMDVTFDNGRPEYEQIGVHMEFKEKESGPWKKIQEATVELSVDDFGQEEALNETVRLWRWKMDCNEGWKIDTKGDIGIYSLRHAGRFELFLMRLKASRGCLVVDVTDADDYVTPDEEPQVVYR